MRKPVFLLEYLKSPRTVGAVAPSSQKLAVKMLEEINYNRAECIVEYGPGTGIFTEHLVRNKSKETLLLVFEYNEKFYRLLKRKYEKIQNVIIIHDSAELVSEYLKKYGISGVDYVVSGLPFASLNKEVSTRILESTRCIMKEGGRFLTFQYTLLKKKMIAGYFNRFSFKKVFFNLPPAYVFICEK